MKLVKQTNGEQGRVYLGVVGTKEEAQGVVDSLFNNGITDAVEPEELGEQFYYTVLPNPEALIEWLRRKEEKKFDIDRLNSVWFSDFLRMTAERAADLIPVERFIRFGNEEINFFRFLLSESEDFDPGYSFPLPRK